MLQHVLCCAVLCLLHCCTAARTLPAGTPNPCAARTTSKASRFTRDRPSFIAQVMHRSSGGRCMAGAMTALRNNAAAHAQVRNRLPHGSTE